HPKRPRRACGFARRRAKAVGEQARGDRAEAGRECPEGKREGGARGPQDGGPGRLVGGARGRRGAAYSESQRARDGQRARVATPKEAALEIAPIARCPKYQP